MVLNPRGAFCCPLLDHPPRVGVRVHCLRRDVMLLQKFKCIFGGYRSLRILAKVS